MAKKITEIDTSLYEGDGIIVDWKFPKYVKGFYYDHELNNPLTRVTLHANKKYKPADKTKLDGPWEPVPDPDPNDKSAHPYDLTPIATSIFAEDFSFDIANTFSDFGGDPIGEMWNSMAGTAPYSAMVGSALETIAQKTREWKEKKETIGEGKNLRWADVIEKVGSFMGDAATKNAAYHSRALHVNGTQFQYYSGSGINFNNMSMKFTLLSDWEGSSFRSVIQKLTDGDWPLLAYVIGDYVKVTEIGEGEVKDFISDYASWQLPPGGFRANLKNVDVINEGTLKLRFGPYFSIPNLIISGCSISMSKEMIRNPQGSGKTAIVPMSCDVTLQFKPSAQFSKSTLENVLTGEVGYLKDVVTKKEFTSVQQK